MEYYMQKSMGLFQGYKKIPWDLVLNSFAQVAIRVKNRRCRNMRVHGMYKNR